MNEPNKNKKKWRLKFIIFPSFQLTLIGVNLLILLGAGVAFGIGAYNSFGKLRDMGLKVGLPKDHSYFKFLSFQYEHLSNYLIIALIIALIISLIITVLVSHKFAGPLVRLKGFFKDIGSSGKVYELKFREGDYLSDLPAEVNNALKKIKKGD